MAKITRLEVTDALKQAIQVELDLRRFYEAAVSLERVAKNRELLEALLAEEQEHKRQFDRRYEELTGHKLLYLNVDKRRRLVELVTNPSDGENLIEQAVDNEQKAVQFYEEAANLIPPGWLRQAFEELAEKERAHVALLRERLKAEEETENGDGRAREAATADAA